MLSRIDQTELLLALHDRNLDPPFDRFLSRLRRRVGAGAAFIVSREHGRSHCWRSGVDITVEQPLLDMLRPGRAYDLRELDERQPPLRAVRETSIGGDRWLVIGDGIFSAADGALLTSLAPHVALACDVHNCISELERDAAMAGAALARVGVGWSLVDRQGTRLAGEPSPMGRRDISALTSGVANGATSVARGDTLAIAAPGADRNDAALLLRRTPTAGRDRAGAFAAIHGVSLPEARLAVALAEGASIKQAAARLGMTEQTARFYSKRLYAATGTNGQADLVRLFWTGPAALA